MTAKLRGSRQVAHFGVYPDSDTARLDGISPLAKPASGAIARRAVARMKLARAGHSLVRGGRRCRVRFRFVGGNFVPRSMALFATMPMIAAAPADADTNR